MESVWVFCFIFLFSLELEGNYLSEEYLVKRQKRVPRYVIESQLLEDFMTQ